MFLLTQQSHCYCITWLQLAFPQLSSASECKAVVTVHTCMFRYCINCYNSSLLFIYLLAY